MKPKMEDRTFVTQVLQHYRNHGRQLPWRQTKADGSLDAYKILVSEVMLQQTQVTRVIMKYQEFLEYFPTLQTLASTSLAEVLKVWSGLGYNRRAKYLWLTAKKLAGLSQPWNFETLVACPGIGPNTAAAIMVYAFNEPRVFIETNIRTVYIHHFFKHELVVSDAAIINKVTATYDQKNPRVFYWALMDYGSYLKARYGNPARRSIHYTPQSKFEGSMRQLRGQIVRLLTQGNLTSSEIESEISDPRLHQALEALIQEGLLEVSGITYSLRTT